MGRKAKLKQGNPTPLASSNERPQNKGKKRASAADGARHPGKAAKGVVKPVKRKQELVRRKPVDEEDDDSDMEDALRPGWVI